MILSSASPFFRVIKCSIKVNAFTFVQTILNRPLSLTVLMSLNVNLTMANSRGHSTLPDSK
nr:hypothetical protein [Helicoverpa armigera nucleopolyhedrovirus]